MTASRAHSWARAEEVAVVESDERLVVLDLAHLDRPPVALSPTAASVWHAVDGRRTGRDVVAEVADLWGVAAERIHRDVEGLLERLAEAGLVVPVEDPR